MYRSQLIVQLRRVWGVHFARVNARLKLARVHSAQGRGLPTAAGRGRLHTAHARVDTDSNFHGGNSATVPPRTPAAASAAECERRFCAPLRQHPQL